MTSRPTSAPNCLRTNYRHGNTVTYGASTQNDDAVGRRICMAGLPRETKVDDIIKFFEPGSVEGMTIIYGPGLKTIAFVQFARPSDYTEALLKNCQPFLNTRASIRTYKKGEHASPQSAAKRRSFAEREQTEDSSKRSPAIRNRNRSSERTTRETPSSSHSRNRSRSPDTGRSPTGSRVSERSSSYRIARSPLPRRRSRSRSPSVRSHARVRSPERSSHSERPKRYERSRRSPDRARSRSTSADRDRHRRNRERSPSLDRNFSRRPDPFLANDMPNPSEEMLVKQSLALWKQQPQAAARIPISHVFGANGAPLPNLPGTSMTQAIAYTTQSSQSSYVAQASASGISGGLFNGNLDRMFPGQAQSRALQLQATTSNGNGSAPAAPVAAASEMPAGVEYILKLILEYKSARNFSLFQIDSVLNYLQEQKRAIQRENAAGDPSTAIEAPPTLAVDTAGDVVNVGSSDDLRNRLNQNQSDENLFELARKIQRIHGQQIKEERE